MAAGFVRRPWHGSWAAYEPPFRVGPNSFGDWIRTGSRHVLHWGWQDAAVMTTQAPLPGGIPPTTQRATSPPASRLFSWLVSSVLVGWVIAYNVLRIGGRSPRGAAWTSLLIGVGIGIGIFAIVVLVWRQYIASGRFRPHHIEEIPPPDRLDSRQRGALEVLWPAVAVLAVAALAVGAILAASWLQTEGTRSFTRVVLAVWDLLVGAWLVMETVELRRGHGEAVESIALAAMLTAVLAGVAFSRGMFEPWQVALIVLAGVGGALAHFAGWRLLGSRGVPLGILVTLSVAALSIVLPIVL